MIFKYGVLNLVINGLPSILDSFRRSSEYFPEVLNLVINGLPSIPKNLKIKLVYTLITVLNLVINGLPSILQLLP